MKVSGTLKLVRSAEQRVFAKHWALELHTDWQRNTISVDRSAWN
tara:strand:+ start:337 stop:468 length:132 start_codon:yes stop_codon:yes gene_type:complete